MIKIIIIIKTSVGRGDSFDKWRKQFAKHTGNPRHAETRTEVCRLSHRNTVVCGQASSSEGECGGNRKPFVPFSSRLSGQPYEMMILAVGVQRGVPRLTRHVQFFALLLNTRSCEQVCVACQPRGRRDKAVFVGAQVTSAHPRAPGDSPQDRTRPVHPFCGNSPVSVT